MVLGIIFVLIDTKYELDQAYSGIIEVAFSLLPYLLFGFLGTRLYYIYVKQKIAHVKKLNLEPGAHLARLKKRGGTSNRLYITAVLLFILFGLLLS